MPVLREVAQFTGPVVVIDPTRRQHAAHAFLHAYDSIQFRDGREVAADNGVQGWAGTLQGDLPWADLSGAPVTVRLDDSNEARAVVTSEHDHRHALIRGSGQRPF
jgi:hypothetical protein